MTTVTVPFNAPSLQPSRRTVLAGFAAASAVTVPAVAIAGDHPDAKLLRLGQEMEAAWAGERATRARMKGQDSDEADEITEAAMEAVSEVVGRIEGLQATTLEGLQVKARTLLWCYEARPKRSTLPKIRTPPTTGS
jgi:hypothetical protein